MAVRQWVPWSLIFEIFSLHMDLHEGITIEQWKVLFFLPTEEGMYYKMITGSPDDMLGSVEHFLKVEQHFISQITK